MKKYLVVGISLASVLLLATSPHAMRGPIHKTLRAYAMGNAFTALAYDKDAVYYNPANLWLINRLGNYKKTPELGFYPRNIIDMRLNFGPLVPISEALKSYQLSRDIAEVYQRAMSGNENNTNALIDTLAAYPELADRLNAFDRRPIPLGAKVDAELAFHGPFDIGLGGAIWVDGLVSPYIDGGIISPSAGVEQFFIDAVMQGGMGFRVHPKWLVGLGGKVAQRVLMEDVGVSLLEFEETREVVEEKVDSTARKISDIYRLGLGLDFATTYLYTRDMRFSAALRNVFVKPIGSFEITPDLAVGMAFSPRQLQRNTAYARKVNFAADLENLLDASRNYKFFSKVNFGMEVEQTLLAWPGTNNALRALKGRLGTGFKGGYWTFGGALEVLRFVQFEFATWAEETGFYTGEHGVRYWMGQISLGI